MTDINSVSQVHFTILHHGLKVEKSQYINGHFSKFS
jgi:hypothetical protein